MDENFKVKVNESFKYNLKSSEADLLDLLKLERNKFHVLKNAQSFHINIDESDFNNKKYVVNVNSSSYTVKISDKLDMLINKMGFSVGTTKRANDVKAPMPGIILSVNVCEGQEVKEGETLLILEAMKMENAIVAPKDGFIESVKAKAGYTVVKGELMIKMAK